MPRSYYFIFLLVAVSAVACGGVAKNDAPTATQTPTTNTATATSDTATVIIDSPDGVKLVGSLFAAKKSNSPALLLLHQWQSDRHSYDEFARRMQSRGFAVLSIDGRGFGESTKKADGSTITAGRTDADVKAMLGDVGAAFDYLSKQPNVDAKRVGIVGASYGSSLAIIYAADHPEVVAVALLSPGINYFGNMPTEPAVKKYGDRKLIFFAAEDDKESSESVRKLNPVRVDNPEYPEHIFPSGGHGTALLNVGAGQVMSDFFAGAFDLANLHLKN